MIVFVGAIVAGGTGAFFNDTETSEGNIFTAGAIDLLVDSEAHYAGLVCSAEGVWQVADDQEGTTRPDLIGDDCDGTWTETNLGPTFQFFSIDDIKPGDEGENTISLHVYDNDAYACAIIDNLQDNDLGLTEPEFEDGDTTNGVGNGELAPELNFFAWADNGVGGGVEGDNIWNGDEPMLFTNETGPASDVLDGVAYPLYAPFMNNGAVLQATNTAYIGFYWCYGSIEVDENTNSLTCDGSSVTNVSQTDELTADISFYVEQARNNENFTCPQPENDDVVVDVNATEVFSETDRVEAFLAGNWFFYNDSNDTIMTINEFGGDDGENDIQTGPEAVDAAKMVLHDAGARYNIATYQFSATPLAMIDTLKYRIYDASPSGETPYLHFNIDFDNSDTWQRRLVQVPDGVVEDTWTEVDALADTWTLSGGNWPAGGSEDGNTPGSTPKTWASILADYPTAALRTTDSFFGVRVGHPGPDGEESYVDWIEFDEVLYDFVN